MEVISPIVKDCFIDKEDEEGVNAKGVFSVKMRLRRKFPTSAQHDDDSNGDVIEALGTLNGHT